MFIFLQATSFSVASPFSSGTKSPSAVSCSTPERFQLSSSGRRRYAAHPSNRQQPRHLAQRHPPNGRQMDHHCRFCLAALVVLLFFAVFVQFGRRIRRLSPHLWHDEGGKATYPFSLFGGCNTTPVYRWKVLYNAALFASMGILVRSSSPLSLSVLADEFVSSLSTDPVHLPNGRVQRRRFKRLHRHARSLFVHLLLARPLCGFAGVRLCLAGEVFVCRGRARAGARAFETSSDGLDGVLSSVSTTSSYRSTTSTCPLISLTCNLLRQYLCSGLMSLPSLRACDATTTPDSQAAFLNETFRASTRAKPAKMS